MGSFAGHVLPGSLFVIYGTMWITFAILTHLKSKAISVQKTKPNRAKRDHSVKTGKSFFEYKKDVELSRKSWLPFPCPVLSRVPIEPVLKIVLSFIGILVEAFLSVIEDRDGKAHIVGSVYHIYQNDGHLNGLDKLQHITMYGAFMLSGIIDILTILVKFPQQTSPLFLMLAFSVEGVLFYFHTGGRDHINIQIHFILTLVIGICVLFAFLRVMYATSLIINLGLGFSIFLQGSWFIQAAYFLFPPGGNGIIINEMNRHNEGNNEHHAAVMFVACCLTWHVMFIVIGVLVLWVVLLVVMRSSAGRRFLKRRGALKINPPQKWDDFAEKEKLINNEDYNATADLAGDGDINETQPVVVEMQQLSDVETATL